jgi:4-hydroxy-3-polyprenylbenzoate decarboxylase
MDDEREITTTPLGHPRPAHRVVIGLSGASGAIYGVRLLKALKALDVESHLVVTRQAEVTLAHETTMRPEDLTSLAAHHHEINDLSAPIASGSFPTAGMVVAPCSVKTLSAVANSYAGNLLTRAADVILKEGRTLILVVRETPLHLGHLRLMVRAAEMGAVIFPPVPAFYARPATVDALVDQSVGRILARLGLENQLYDVWRGL